MIILAPFELPPGFGLRQCSGAFESGRSYPGVRKRQSTAALQDARAILRLLRKIALTLAVSLLATSGLRADDWPQWLGPQRDGVWRETGIVEKLPTNGFTYRWRVPIGGGYTGPAVANGRVYLMDRQLAKDAKNPANAFARGTIPGAERVLCLNEADGKIVWQHSYDCAYTVSYASGPRVTPVGAGLALSISHNLITATIGRVKSCPSPMLSSYGRAA